MASRKKLWIKMHDLGVRLAAGFILNDSARARFRKRRLWAKKPSKTGTDEFVEEASSAKSVAYGLDNLTVGKRKMLYPTEKIFPLKERAFENFSAFVPADEEFFLDCCYADWPFIPANSNSVHSHLNSKFLKNPEVAMATDKFLCDDTAFPSARETGGGYHKRVAARTLRRRPSSADADNTVNFVPNRKRTEFPRGNAVRFLVHAQTEEEAAR